MTPTSLCGHEALDFICRNLASTAAYTVGGVKETMAMIIRTALISRALQAVI